MTQQTVSPSHRNIVIAPPLSGCSTLGEACPEHAALIDCDSAKIRPPHGTPLTVRKRWFADLVADNMSAPFICLPASPGSEYDDLIAAVVIIPPAVFMKRLAALGEGRSPDGRRIAAITWRDEAVALATRLGIAPHSVLTDVEELSSIRVPLNFQPIPYRRGSTHGPITITSRERPPQRRG